MNEKPEAVDLDRSRRPGEPQSRDPKRWPNAIWPIPRQVGEPASRRRGRSTPVFGTSLPLHGLSGAVRRLAYQYGDDRPLRWMLLLAGDMVDVWAHRVRTLLLRLKRLVGSLRPSRERPLRVAT